MGGSTDKKDKQGIRIAALTWNVGNKAPPDDAVDEFIAQLDGRPEVIALSTQEELAPDGKRLQDKLLAKLNKDLPESEQYEIVIADHHTTMAGANNSMRTLALSLLSSQNRVSSAMLVKKPYKLANAESHIEYEPGKDKGNKSIITLKGTLTLDGKPIQSLSISGGHWDSRTDKKRRAHTDKFLEQQKLKGVVKDFGQIYEEASTFKAIMGDYNERDYLMKDESTVDKMDETNLKGFGFDIDESPKQIIDGQTLPATYGFVMGKEGIPKTAGIPDSRGRANVAKGGYLDRVAFACGLKVTPHQYGLKLNPSKFTAKGKKGKVFYHGSDHLPVLRSFTIDSKQPGQRQVVANYTKARIPDLRRDISDLKMLTDGITALPKEQRLAELLQRVRKLQYYDAALSDIALLYQLAGKEMQTKGTHKIDVDGLIKGLEERRHQKEIITLGLTDLRKQIDGAAQPKPFDESKLAETFLAETFNDLTAANILRNAAREVIAVEKDKANPKKDIISLIDGVLGKPPSEKKLTSQEKSDFMRDANQLIDMYTQIMLGQPVDEKMKAKLADLEQSLEKMAKAHPKSLQKFSQAQQAMKERLEMKINPDLLQRVKALQTEGDDKAKQKGKTTKVAIQDSIKAVKKSATKKAGRIAQAGLRTLVSYSLGLENSRKKPTTPPSSEGPASSEHKKLKS